MGRSVDLSTYKALQTDRDLSAKVKEASANRDFETYETTWEQLKQHRDKHGLWK